MAEGLLRHMCDDAYVVHSAGTQPGIVRNEAIKAMSEIGIDISHHRSKSVDEFSDRTIDHVLTVCDNAKENCPYFPAATKVIHKSFDDPATVSGEEEDRLNAFRRVRDEIRSYIQNDLLPSLSDRSYEEERQYPDKKNEAV